MRGLLSIETEVAGKIDLVPDLRSDSIGKWEYFASKWRTKLHEVDVDRTDKFLESCVCNAIANLDMMVGGPKDIDRRLEDNFMAPADPGFLIRLVRVDPDLTLLRIDSKFNHYYLDWLEKNSQEESRLTSFDRVKGYCPWDLDEDPPVI